MQRLAYSFALLLAWGVAIPSGAWAVPPANSVNGASAGGGGGANYYPSRGTVSPYLTLSPAYGGFAGGGFTGINYYTFIRPELRQQQINQQQTFQMNQLQQEQNLILNGQQPIYGQNGLPSIRPTGTRSWFMTHQSYFGAGAAGGMTGRGGMSASAGGRTFNSSTPRSTQGGY